MRHTKVRGFYSEVYFLSPALFRISVFTFARSSTSFYLLHNYINTELCDFFRGVETEQKHRVEQSYFVKTTRL